jgi:hypothetical protein
MRRYWFIPAAIVLILAVAFFFVGWVQLSLAPDTYGVIFTKTQGFERTIVNPQGITWRWERLIPGALTLYRFPLNAQSVEIPVTGSLPSGEVYAALAPEKPDFTFEVRLSLTYVIKPEILPGLAESSRFRPDGLSDLYRTLVQEISAKVASLALDAPVAPSEKSSEAVPGAQNISGLAERIQTELPKSFAHVEFLSITTNVVRVPDVALYQRLRETYLSVAAVREESLRSAAGRLAAQEAAQEAAEKKHERTISVLEKYGALLDKHPALIKFLFLASAKSISALDLQSLDILGKLDQLE